MLRQGGREKARQGGREGEKGDACEGMGSVWRCYCLKRDIGKEKRRDTTCQNRRTNLKGIKMILLFEADKKRKRQ